MVIVEGKFVSQMLSLLTGTDRDSGYVFPGFPSKIEGRDALMALYSGYGDSTVLHSGDALIVHRSQDPRVLIIEYEVHGKKIATGKPYDNRFISVATIEDRKIVHWRDY